MCPHPATALRYLGVHPHAGHVAECLDCGAVKSLARIAAAVEADGGERQLIVMDPTVREASHA